jgi:formylmethanofuran dehydrogenase subunit D
MFTSNQTCVRTCIRTSDRTSILTLCRFVSMFAKATRARCKQRQFKNLRRRLRLHERPESHKKSLREAPLHPGDIMGSNDRSIDQTTNRRSRIAPSSAALVIRVRFEAPKPLFCSAEAPFYMADCSFCTLESRFSGWNPVLLAGIPLCIGGGWGCANKTKSPTWHEEATVAGRVLGLWSRNESRPERRALEFRPQQGKIAVDPVHHREGQMAEKRFTLHSVRTSKQGQQINVGKDHAEYEAIVNVLTMNPEDMKDLNIPAGGKVRIRTEIGEATFSCQAGKVPLGMIFVAYGPPTCRLYGGETDGTGMPTTKGWEVEVSVEPVA